MMTAEHFQMWLNAHGANLKVDGQCGAQTRKAIMDVFINIHAPAVIDADIQALAMRLGCSVKQLKAVSIVESGGSAYDDQGRPKILFERHIFSRLTNRLWDTTSFSNPKGGGYNESSWGKLVNAACKNAEAAFSSISIGKFQIMGMHWSLLGYPSPIDMAYEAVKSEAASYEMLARFIEKNNMKGALQRISTDPADNVAFASRYNGAGFKKFKYDEKLAQAMA